MLEVINRYIHGYVSIPVILACREKGIFNYFNKRQSFNLEQITKEFNANEGHLQVALRLFESLGWLKSQHSLYEVLIPQEIYETIEALPKKIIFIYKIPINAFLSKLNHKLSLLISLMNKFDKHPASKILLDFLEGVIVTPLLIALKKDYFTDEHSYQRPLTLQKLPQALIQFIVHFFLQKGWVEQKEEDPHLTHLGKFMLERAFNMATAASYAPMLAKIPELLFGNCQKVFKRDADNHELHLDRSLNVLASGFQHEKYFTDIDAIILSIFNREPFTEQPNLVIDMGCGDGTLLKRIYNTITTQSERGLKLKEYPIAMIGVDYNEKSLTATKHTLKDIPYHTLKGNINNPKAMTEDLTRLHINDLNKALHVRSFLDHDRPFIGISDPQALKERSLIPYSGVYVDKKGQSIPAAVIVQSLVEHLKRWSSILNTQQGLIILEVHSLTPEVILASLDNNESLHFDALQAFSGQYLIPAEIFLMSAAESGLFSKKDFAKKYPRTFPYARITLNYFEKRSYTLGYAKTTDIADLLQLEADCWPEHLQVKPEILLKRIKQFPEGQIIVKMNSQIIGVIYTQQISNVEELKNTPFHLINTLHTPKGNIIQLLAINITPSMQDRGLGDALLSFVLQWCTLKAGIEKVVGVTRCLNYKNYSNLSLQEYIEKHNTNEKGLDPILRFHTSHGAKIVDILPNYRQEDVDNKGAGILIEYAIHEETITEAFISNNQNSKIHDSIKKNIAEKFHQCMIKLLPQQYASQFNKSLPLREMGFDSLALLELRTLIEKSFNIKLNPTFFFEYSTPIAIEDYLESLAKPKLSGSSSPLIIPTKPEPLSSGEREPIAIIGMACRFPGGIKNTNHYWYVLENGIDTITVVPTTRWKQNDYEEFPIHYGGYLDDVDKFDAEFFNIPPREAKVMDPQQRFLLEVSWEALEDAGINPKTLNGKKVGVFVGIFSDDYATLIKKYQSIKTLNGYFGTGNSASVAAGRISYVLGLEGPALAVNTACSSSLVAVHLACQSLNQGESELALACGVNLILSPELSIAFSKAGMLSEDGRCKTFDMLADGYGRSEGCAVLILKKLSKALSDRDNVLAVLRNSVVNQDGASNGLTAPNKSAQINLLQSVFEGTSLTPARVNYFETHGTGTILGDPIEISAIAKVYGHNRRENPLLLGSVKTNLGHTEAVAGMAGLIKVILSLKNGLIPANIHLSKLNPHISLDEFYGQIPTVNVTWPTINGYPRVAVVSSFGFSGTNAHVLLEENSIKQLSSARQHKPYYLVTLSAKNSNSLEQKIEDLQSYLQKHLDLSLETIAYTLNAGRSHFNRRCAIVISSTEDLQEKLLQIQNNQKPSYYFNGDSNNFIETKHDKDLIEILEKLHKSSINPDEYKETLLLLANLYINGYNLDWELLHQGEIRQKISLPSYPFTKQSYWYKEFI